MKVFPEMHDISQFVQASHMPYHTIKRPYINFGSSMPFKYQEYEANIKLQCVHFQRLIKACINVYGYFDFMEQLKCMEATTYF